MMILQLLVPQNLKVVFPAPVPAPVSMFSSFCDDSIPGFSFERGLGDRPDFASNVGGLEIFAEHPGGDSKLDFCKTFDRMPVSWCKNIITFETFT